MSNKIELEINARPLSINSMYYGNRAHGKTSEARDWTYDIIYKLFPYEKQFKELRDVFDPKEYGYKVGLIFEYEEFYTTNGTVSSRTQDLSNCEKSLIDILFLPKYFIQSAPYGFRNLNVDDKYLVELNSCKRLGNDSKIIISIELIATHP